jgi:ubiquinone/menaquinone biosynthesis C-methylase UbiE
MNIGVAGPAGTLQAVSETSRLRLLRLLSRQELNVQELVAILEMRQPSVSRHLAVLREAGWIVQRREGTYSWYRVATPAGMMGGPELQRSITAIAERVAEAADDDRRLVSVLAARELRRREHFAGLADRWDRVRRQFEHPDLQGGMVAALVPPGLRVIDVGTGTGALLPVLARAAERVVAVDQSQALLVRARRRCLEAGCGNVDFQRADVRELPFPAGAFAAAYASMVLHHVDDPGQALRELARVTAPGGRVVVVDFTSHDLHWMRDELAHRWLGFSRQQLAAWAAAAGLVPEQWLQRPRLADTNDEASPTGGGRDGLIWPDVLLMAARRLSTEPARA